MYLRYDTTISREFFRTLDALTRLQRARQVRKSPPLPGFAAAAAAGQVLLSRHPQAILPQANCAPNCPNSVGIRFVAPE